MATDISLQRNPANGGHNFVWKNGDVVFTTTNEHEVMSRLVETRNQWWADTTGTRGSRIFLITEVTASTKSDAEAFAREALQPMIDAEKIVIKDVQVDVLRGGRPVIQVFWQNVNGGPVVASKVFV